MLIQSRGTYIHTPTRTDHHPKYPAIRLTSPLLSPRGLGRKYIFATRQHINHPPHTTSLTRSRLNPQSEAKKDASPHSRHDLTKLLTPSGIAEWRPAVRAARQSLTTTLAPFESAPAALLTPNTHLGRRTPRHDRASLAAAAVTNIHTLAARCDVYPAPACAGGGD